MRIDVNAFLGRYPYRRVTGGSPVELRQAMDRVGIDEAWISNLDALFWRDPTEGNEMLYRATTAAPGLRPVPAVHPGLANWESVLDEAVERRTPCVRVDPGLMALPPTGPEMAALVERAAWLEVPLLMSVRLEDGRQRHPNDAGGELPAWAVRSLVRMDPAIRLLITHADREFIEQVHFGATPDEARRILWDICWLWGPPADDLEHLIRALGADRFCFGTGMPLRIPESSVAKLELTNCSPALKAAIEGENARRFGR